MIKIAVITTTRADYGLLSPLLREMQQDSSIDMHLLVSGTHLLEHYGNTLRYITDDGMPVSHTISIYDEDFISDELHSAQAIAKAAEQCGKIFQEEKYDGILVLGDRYELLGFCSAAVVHRIPIIHIHGGEITEGAIDDKIRHAITKLSSIHFPSIQEYADRILQMGESRDRVFAVGALGIDNIMHLPLLEKAELLTELDIETSLPIAAVTYHPVTSHCAKAARNEIVEVLEGLLAAEVFSIVTMPNSDVGGDYIYEEIVKYEKKEPAKFIIKKSLGQNRYLSLLKSADIMVGNSSSGILESASFLLPTVNIGERQKGRMAPKNVINCPCTRKEITSAIQKGMSAEFHNSLKGYGNPYGDGNTAKKITEILKTTDFTDNTLISKGFEDVK